MYLKFSSKWAIIVIVCITLFASTLAMTVYTGRTLHGNMDHFILSSEFFGIPEDLREKGISALYHAPDSGWDGQFYYYIANDPLALKDTPAHIDASAYRYQRAGFSILAKIASVITFQDWVSPKFYYVSYLLLVLLATYVAASFFTKRGYSPWLALLWSLGFGTQITLLNALPDAAADAFFILAIAALFSNHFIIYAIVMSFCVLTREAYVLFPSITILVSFGYCLVSQSRESVLFRICQWFRRGETWAYAVPVLIFLIWQVYIRIHFNIAPSSQAHGVLGLPFVAWWAYLVSGLQGNHLLVGVGFSAKAEVVMLLFFAGLVFFTTLQSFMLMLQKPKDPKVLGLACAAFLLSMLYFCFGPTVMMHHTGYMKAANLFLFLSPLMICLSRRRINFFLIIYLASFTVLGLAFLWKLRVLPM